VAEQVAPATDALGVERRPDAVDAAEARAAVSLPIRYALAEPAVIERGRATALFGAVATMLPPLLVMVLVAQLDLAPRAVVIAIAALVVALGAARGAVGYRLVLRRLRALVIRIDPEALVVDTARASLVVPRRAVAKIIEIDGPLGGLRLELRGGPDLPDLPDRVDLPRGGEHFADLRTELALWSPLTRAPRRRRLTRVGLGALVVLAIFFVPFFVDDVVMRSRVAACAVILGLWLATRAALARV
jgi:hypothetical protein